MPYEVREAYLESKVLSADPLELVRLLYQGAIEAIGHARRCLAASDIAGRSREITRAYAILTELTLALDHQAGGEIARNLAELYDYMQRRLLEANIHQQDGPLAEVASLLATLLEGWKNCHPEPEAATANTAMMAEAIPDRTAYVAHSWSG
ncbi:MAG: flagellar export chaperone FliS [Bryobacteraceae bacterium]